MVFRVKTWQISQLAKRRNSELCKFSKITHEAYVTNCQDAFCLSSKQKFFLSSSCVDFCDFESLSLCLCKRRLAVEMWIIFRQSFESVAPWIWMNEFFVISKNPAPTSIQPSIYSLIHSPSESNESNWAHRASYEPWFDCAFVRWKS